MDSVTIRNWSCRKKIIITKCETAGREITMQFKEKYTKSLLNRRSSFSWRTKTRWKNKCSTRLECYRTAGRRITDAPQAVQVPQRKADSAADLNKQTQQKIINSTSLDFQALWCVSPNSKKTERLAKAICTARLQLKKLGVVAMTQPEKKQSISQNQYHQARAKYFDFFHSNICDIFL